jgi:sugar/nucleoside kinase (ribokinase family)
MNDCGEPPIVDHKVRQTRSSPIDVFCVGEALWDFYAPRGIPLERAKLLRRVPGGGAVNTATELSRLGVSSALCAALGDDALGRGLRDEVAARGVDVSGVVLGAARTGILLVALERGGGARFLGYRQREAEARALAEALPGRWRARVVHFSGVAPVRGTLSALRLALARARREGCAVSVDVNARPRMWPAAGRGAAASAAPRAGFRLAREADLVKCSAGDLAVLGVTARALRGEMRPGATLVVTDGARATRVLGPRDERSIVPRPVRVVDPAGAGDAFCAGLLAALLDERAGALGVEEALEDAAPVLRAVARGHEVARAWLKRRRS